MSQGMWTRCTTLSVSFFTFHRAHCLSSFVLNRCEYETAVGNEEIASYAKLSCFVKVTTNSKWCNAGRKDTKQQCFKRLETKMLQEWCFSVIWRVLSTDVQEKHLLWSPRTQDVTAGVSRLDQQAADRRGGEKRGRGGRGKSQGVGWRRGEKTEREYKWFETRTQSA